MTNVLLAGVIICQLLPLLIGLAALVRLKSLVLRNVRSFLEPPAEGQPSQAAVILDLVSTRLASAITASIKGFLMGENSVAIKEQRRAALQEVTGSSPILAGLQAFAPGLVRKFGKNPELLQAAMQLFQGAGKPREEANSGNNGGSVSSNPFRIN
jgi:hypothetical protein